MRIAIDDEATRPVNKKTTPRQPALRAEDRGWVRIEGGGMTGEDTTGWWCEPGGEDRGLPVRIGGYREDSGGGEG